jgi:hypothetical protein
MTRILNINMCRLGFSALLFVQLTSIELLADTDSVREVGATALMTQLAGHAILGKTVRAHAQDRSEIQGRVVYCQSDSLFLVDGAGKYGISLESIDELWVRNTRTKRGLVTGAVIGGILGGMLGAIGTAIGNGTCEYECSDTSPVVGGFLGAGLGAIPGGAIGAGIGAIARKWDLYYKSQPLAVDKDGVSVWLYPLIGVERRDFGLAVSVRF